MAKDRETPCKYYVCFGVCMKGRKADHKHYCQKCDKYVPRVKEKHINKKKRDLQKQQEREYRNERDY